MCSKKKILALESRDLSRAKKEIIADNYFYSKRQPRAIFCENSYSCHFVNLLSLARNHFEDESTLEKKTLL